MIPSYDVTDVIDHPMMSATVKVYTRQIGRWRWRVREWTPHNAPHLVVQEETPLPDEPEGSPAEYEDWPYGYSTDPLTGRTRYRG